MLYASELTWNGQDKVEKPYQLAISRMARATLRVHQTTSRGTIMAESGFTPTGALLDHQRARFAQRLYARPQRGQGPEEIWKESQPSPRACKRLRGWRGGGGRLRNRNGMKAGGLEEGSW